MLLEINSNLLSFLHQHQLTSLQSQVFAPFPRSLERFGVQHESLELNSLLYLAPAQMWCGIPHCPSSRRQKPAAAVDVSLKTYPSSPGAIVRGPKHSIWILSL